MFKKILCAVLCLCIVLSLCSCGGGTVIATYEGLELDSAMYALHLAIEKRAVEEYYYYYYQTDISSKPAFWDEYYNEELKMTWTDYVENEFCNMLVAMKFCKDHDIKLTDESANADMEALLEDYVKTAGSKDLLNLELARYGADYDMLVEYLKCYQYINLMKEYLVEDGTFTAGDDEIMEVLNEYWKFDYMLYETVDSNSKPIVDSDITTEQAKEFFLSDYVTVKHILYVTSNLSDDKKAEKKAKAEANLQSILDGKAEFEDFKADNEDRGFEYTFTYGTMTEAFEEAAYDMEPGEVRLVETIYGYHLMLKEELKEEAFTDMESEVKAAVTAKRIQKEAEAMLEKLESGEAEFKKAEKDEYRFGEGMMVHKEDDTVPKELYETLKNTKVGEYAIYRYGSYGFYIFKHVEFDQADVDEYGDDVSVSIINEKFTEYLASLAGMVEVNREEMSKYDIKTVRSFFSKTEETK